MAEVIEYRFESARDQGQALADRVAGTILARGGTLVLTGGGTVGPFYEAFSKQPLPWDKVRIVLSDERWVPVDHADSNERRLREELLRGPAAAAGFTSLKTAAPDPQAALPEVEAAVAVLPRPFAFTLLGMGEDGHVASLFPGAVSADDLDRNGPRLVVASRAPDGLGRISLSMRALLDADAVAVVIRGDAKRAVVAAALQGRSPELPIGALLRQARRPVELYWAP